MIAAPSFKLVRNNLNIQHVKHQNPSMTLCKCLDPPLVSLNMQHQRNTLELLQHKVVFLFIHLVLLQRNNYTHTFTTYTKEPLFKLSIFPSVLKPTGSILSEAKQLAAFIPCPACCSQLNKTNAKVSFCHVIPFHLHPLRHDLLICFLSVFKTNNCPWVQHFTTCN